MLGQLLTGVVLQRVSVFRPSVRTTLLNILLSSPRLTLMGISGNFGGEVHYTVGVNVVYGNMWDLDDSYVVHLFS